MIKVMRNVVFFSYILARVIEYCYFLPILGTLMLKLFIFISLTLNIFNCGDTVDPPISVIKEILLDTIYYTDDWEGTTRSQAQYYRIVPFNQQNQPVGRVKITLFLDKFKE